MQKIKNKKLLIPIFDKKGKCKPLSLLVDEVIYSLLDTNQDNYKEVARLLSVGESTTYNRMKDRDEDN